MAMVVSELWLKGSSLFCALVLLVPSLSGCSLFGPSCDNNLTWNEKFECNWFSIDSSTYPAEGYAGAKVTYSISHRENLKNTSLRIVDNKTNNQLAIEEVSSQNTSTDLHFKLPQSLNIAVELVTRSGKVKQKNKVVIEKCKPNLQLSESYYSKKTDSWAIDLTYSCLIERGRVQVNQNSYGYVKNLLTRKVIPSNDSDDFSDVEGTITITGIKYVLSTPKVTASFESYSGAGSSSATKEIRFPGELDINGTPLDTPYKFEADKWIWEDYKYFSICYDVVPLSANVFSDGEWSKPLKIRTGGGTCRTKGYTYVEVEFDKNVSPKSFLRFVWGDADYSLKFLTDPIDEDLEDLDEPGQIVRHLNALGLGEWHKGGVGPWYTVSDVYISDAYCLIYFADSYDSAEMIWYSNVQTAAYLGGWLWLDAHDWIINDLSENRMCVDYFDIVYGGTYIDNG